jgi:predicted nuclease of predicted toxin-antitoxin system
VQKRLKSLGYDCWRWEWIGDREAPDPTIAATADAKGRAVISDDVPFLDWRRTHVPIFGFHVHMIGRKRNAADLIESKIGELAAKVRAKGVGIYVLEAGQPVKYERGPVG